MDVDQQSVKLKFVQMPEAEAKSKATPAAKPVDVKKSPEYKELLAENAKLAKQLAGKAKAIKGMQTQVANLKEKVAQGGVKKMHVTHH